jgi:protein phosphatase
MPSFPYHGETDRRTEGGGFDIIGDVHGCADELEALLCLLGYGVTWREGGGERRAEIAAPRGRRAVFVGDLVDRGPRTPDVLRIAMALCADGTGFAVPGNHDHKFRRWLAGSKVVPSHGLERSMAQVEAEPRAFRDGLLPFLAALPIYLRLDGGRLVVAHAGILEPMIGAPYSGRIHEFCIFGDTDGKTDAAGLSVRYDWTPRYGGAATIVYGHTPVADPVWSGNTVCIDTACCFGGRLTALRWPERELVSVPAQSRYWPAGRPLGLPAPRD